MSESNRSVMCIYCGEAVIYDSRRVTDMAQALARLVEHDQHCSKNPLVAELSALRWKASELEKDARRYRYIRDHQYWTRYEGNDIDPGFSCVGVKFEYHDDFQARIMLDHHIDKRIAEQGGGS